MATKTETKKYKYMGTHDRAENGKRIKPGSIVDLSHLKTKDINFLLIRGIYNEVK